MMKPRRNNLSLLSVNLLEVKKRTIYTDFEDDCILRSIFTAYAKTCWCVDLLSLLIPEMIFQEWAIVGPSASCHEPH